MLVKSHQWEIFSPVFKHCGLFSHEREVAKNQRPLKENSLSLLTNLFFVFCSSSSLLSTLCLSCSSSLLIHPILLEQKMGSPIERSEVRSIEYVWPSNAWLCDQRCLLTRICMNDGTCLIKMKSTGFYLEWQYLSILHIECVLKDKHIAWANIDFAYSFDMIWKLCYKQEIRKVEKASDERIFLKVLNQ